MRFKRVIATFTLAAMIAPLAACGNSKGTEDEKNKDGKMEAEGYTYGLNQRFHSDEPVVYPMMYSNHESYLTKDDWMFWDELKELTNVSFDLDIIPREDYDIKKSLLVEYEKAAYIIPKTYDDSAFSTDDVLPVSDYVQYMPNYMEFVKKYNMEDDLKTITRQDGKYYRLPGMWEQPNSEYSWVVRKDVFEKAGVDIASMEKTMTWADFYRALKKVAIANPGKPIWSDRWMGDSLLKIAGATFNVPAGWAIENGMSYNSSTDSFYFAETSGDYKEFVTYFNRLVKEGILDPKTFTQEDADAKQKFLDGETFILSANKSEYPAYQKEMDNTLGKGKYELYMIVNPMGPSGNYQYEISRLENGIMISKSALDELGEEGMIKMLRFIDWLWYSEEGQTFNKWGVEGKTYTVKDGVKVLNSDITYGSLNQGAEKALNVDYGFSNGVFMYGGTADLATSMLSDDLKDYFNRIYTYRKIKPIAPAVKATSEEKDKLNLIKEPLMAYVKNATLEFITGKRNIEGYWNEYVSSCRKNSSDVYTRLYNEIYKKSK